MQASIQTHPHALPPSLPIHDIKPTPHVLCMTVAPLQASPPPRAARRRHQPRCRCSHRNPSISTTSRPPSAAPPAAATVPTCVTHELAVYHTTSSQQRNHLVGAHYAGTGSGTGTSIHTVTYSPSAGAAQERYHRSPSLAWVLEAKRQRPKAKNKGSSAHQLRCPQWPSESMRPVVHTPHRTGRRQCDS
jgi:hypothetical protein